MARTAALDAAWAVTHSAPMTHPQNETHPLGVALEALLDTIATRAGGDPSESYTAKLLAQGPAHIAKKLGEEGVEAALAGALRDREELIKESADVLYHLAVLWRALEIAPEAVAEELNRRAGVSGLAEKAARRP